MLADVILTFNRPFLLERTLATIRLQNIPKDQLKVYIVDSGTEDRPHLWEKDYVEDIRGLSTPEVVEEFFASSGVKGLYIKLRNDSWKPQSRFWNFVIKHFVTEPYLVLQGGEVALLDSNLLNEALELAKGLHLAWAPYWREVYPVFDKLNVNDFLLYTKRLNENLSYTGLEFSGRRRRVPVPYFVSFPRDYFIKIRGFEEYAFVVEWNTDFDFIIRLKRSGLKLVPTKGTVLHQRHVMGYQYSTTQKRFCNRVFKKRVKLRVIEANSGKPWGEPIEVEEVREWN